MAWILQTIEPTIRLAGLIAFCIGIIAAVILGVIHGRQDKVKKPPEPSEWILWAAQERAANEKKGGK